MFTMKYLFYVTMLHLTIAAPQINLYYTHWVDENDHALQHDCLHTTSFVEQSDISREIIYYCMGESSSNFKIEVHDFFPKFTFAELSKQNITSQQLYLWSTPIDIVERYQFYLNQLVTLNDRSMTSEIFYNCSLPRFGSMCQYEFDYYDSTYSSLYEIINTFYATFEYMPTHLTCYTHLQCNRGPVPACLDWTEICDGHVDCLDGDFDEEHCWQLEINQCQDNEYRCTNGNCIPQSFYKDDIVVPDCLDASDELPIFLFAYRYCATNELSFRCEDIACTHKPFTSSCVQQREVLLLTSIFSIKDNSVSDDCWSAFKCIIPRSYEYDTICNEFCRGDICIEIINRTCPDMLYIPAVPSLNKHVYFAYQKNDSNIFNNGSYCYPFVCYNNSHYDDYFVNSTKVSFNNKMCYRDVEQPIPLGHMFSCEQDYLAMLYRVFRSYDLIYNYTSTICNRLDMYQCVNSVKCISIYHLRDGFNDCPLGDDEHSNGTDMIENLTEIDMWFYDVAEMDIQYARKTISFQTICDGFTDLLPLDIKGQNETDETECEQWQCNNTYTRCNDYWNCLDGADEVGCNLSPLLNCSSNNHICASPYTNQLICLPVEKANDGIVDCLGATDEPALCRTKYETVYRNKFFCMNQNNVSSCIDSGALCNGYEYCISGDDEQFCETNGTFNEYYELCRSSELLSGSDTEKFVCENMRINRNQPVIYFSLDGMNKLAEDLAENAMLSNSSIIPMPHRYQYQYQYQSRCHRGLDLRVWLNNKNGSTTRTCLCPPNFYGNICQYQNQRVHLAIQFRALSNSWQKHFAIVISLIDDSNERIIHSYEQLTYLSARDCKIKYNIYLLYSTRPKHLTKNYAIHIDIYEKVSLAYRGSLFFPINFPFLPVHRLAFIADIPRSGYKMQICSNRQCVHGQCIKYSNNQEHTHFCQCNPGWSGRYCTISHNCTCSFDSLCVGIAAHNRSICVCPIHKFGSRCLINIACETNDKVLCQNSGQCLLTDEYMVSKQTFICICPKGFRGDRCEIADNKLILSFDKDLVLAQSIFIHFIEIIKNGPPVRATTFKTMPVKQDSIIIQWSRPFHLVFTELFKQNYYLTVVQKTYNVSEIIIKKINPWDRCQHISEIFNKTIIEFHLLRRIKYYHFPCEKYSLNLSCFYDDIHICLCYDYGGKRLANCFEFIHNMTFDCLGQSECENDGQCFQDTPDCPQRSMCVCPPCFYGTRCQFSTNGFGLSLDAILGYHILQHVNFKRQPTIVQISVAITMIFIVVGLINGILALMTFKNKIIREVGCGLYLYGSSITAVVTIIIFGLKFWILILTQMTLISNRIFLSFQCYSMDFLLRICLSMDQWLCACVAFERAIVAKKGTTFSKKKSKQAAKVIIIILLLVIVSTSIHDPLYRRLIDEENEEQEKRIWCIVTYPSSLQTWNSVVYIFHFSGPFLINLISAVILITKKSRRQSNAQTHRTYKQLLGEQFRQHKHLFLAPVLLVILALPRLIISFVSKCMKSAEDSWLFLVGYFISFIPSMLTFVLFILPSKFYKKYFFRNCVAPYQISIQRRGHLLFRKDKSSQPSIH